MRLLLDYICENCGKAFSHSARDGAALRKRFCSRKCSEDFLGRTIEKVCPVCAKTFLVPLGPTTHRVTCSPRCSRIWMTTPPEGLKNLMALREKARKDALRERMAACELCGQGGIVEVVDVDPQSNDNLDGLVVLCPTCRSLYDQGAIRRDELKKRIASQIYGVKVKRVQFVVDERGRLGEIFTRRDLIWRAPAHIYLTTVDYGVTKAWHLHQLQTDNFFCLFGSIKLALFDVRPYSPTFGRINQLVIGEANPLVVQIPPGVLHGFKGLYPPHSMVLNMTDQVYRADNSDEIRVSPHQGEQQQADLARLELPFKSVPFDWARKDG